MSGHSKWATTKRKKEVVDQRRGSAFTKLSNAISVAARLGADPEMNFNLRLAIDRAKAVSMPKENIDRAIARGSGGAGGAQLNHTVYEGFGPGQVAFIMEAISDNSNRTFNELKHLFANHGGILATPGAVSWMFERKGVIIVKNEKLKMNNEEFELKVIDLGAEDFLEEENDIIIYTKPEDLRRVKDGLEKDGIKIEAAGVEYLAKEKMEISDETSEKLHKLIDDLEEHQDVAEYFTNLM
ncbi:MAG: YebC/PmpR family DNA-binding transcriptional regulator [Patescibacteria group bacterium]|nr:YebC/PmpR family DNA-binding transcriptional regulator [Patescibacteria group bacterium]